MSDSYVTSSATIKCSCGDKCAKLTVYPDRTVFLTEKPMGNISDHVSMYNIASFGKCHTTAYPPTGSATAANHGTLTPMPCVPGTVSEWINGKNDYIVKGKPALLQSSYCRCQWGGVITFVGDGQVDTGQADLSQQRKETQDEWEKKEQAELLNDTDALLDGIQTALDLAGFIPGVGAIPDLLNAAIYAVRGDKLNASLSVLAAVPAIGDAAAAAKIAGKGVKAAKAAKAAKKAGNVADAAKDNVASISKHKSAKTQAAIENSDNVLRFPTERASSANASVTKGVQKQGEVARIDKFERKVEKQVNGADKITVTKKTDTIYNMDDYRVNPVHKGTNNGSSTSYGSGSQTSYGAGPNREQHNVNRIKVLRVKKSKGTITSDELKELNGLDPNSIDLF